MKKTEKKKGGLYRVSLTRVSDEIARAPESAI
jgi:hypothetical protein